MNIKINLFDEVQLSLGFEEGSDGRFAFRKAIATFLDRPMSPHLTLFAGEPLRPHFTAARERPNQFRSFLPSVRSADVVAVADRFTEEVVRQSAGRFQPTDLCALEADGWTVHFPDVRALRRWTWLTLHRGHELRVDAESIVAFYGHVVRRWCWPTSLQALLPTENLINPLVVRWNQRSRRPDWRVLLYFPDGPGTPDGTCLPPGWYLSRFQRPLKQLTRILPRKNLEGLADRVMGYLDQYPRKKPFNDDEFGLPPYVLHVWGYYSEMLFNVAFDLVARRAKARARRAATSSPIHAVTAE